MRTPYFLIDEKKLKENLQILKNVADKSGAKILLAQKAYSCYKTYPYMQGILCGSTASGLYEARLGHEEMGGETHIFSPCYREDEMPQILKYADHIVFNSIGQLHKFAKICKTAGKSIGLRINPECSTQGGGIYDPCAKYSRLGVTRKNFDVNSLSLLDGLHMHTLCEQNSDALQQTVIALEEKFGKYLKHFQWLNLGGGHHITRADYDREKLIQIVQYLQQKYQVQVYLEPGEAVVLDAGYLVTTVHDIVENDIQIAILDTSATCHMPDIIEMPYTPRLENADKPNSKAYTYRLAGGTCLAGDVIGDYSFDSPLKIGQQLKFLDMALYTMVKTNTFNGIPLPSIALLQENGKIELLKSFSYADFKSRV